MSEVNIHKCRACAHEFENSPGQKWPSCPKCNALHAPPHLIRYNCDYSGCEKVSEKIPGDGWLRANYTLQQFQLETHWEGSELKPGDVRGNMNAGGFKVFPVCPYNLIFCSLDHEAKGMNERRKELKEVEKKWAAMRGK